MQKVSYFFLLLWVIFALLDPDPGPKHWTYLGTVPGGGGPQLGSPQPGPGGPRGPNPPRPLKGGPKQQELKIKMTCRVSKKDNSKQPDLSEYEFN